MTVICKPEMVGVAKGKYFIPKPSCVAAKLKGN